MGRSNQYNLRPSEKTSRCAEKSGGAGELLKHVSSGARDLQARNCLEEAELNGLFDHSGQGISGVRGDPP